MGTSGQLLLIGHDEGLLSDEIRYTAVVQIVHHPVGNKTHFVPGRYDRIWRHLLLAGFGPHKTILPDIQRQQAALTSFIWRYLVPGRYDMTRYRGVSLIGEPRGLTTKPPPQVFGINKKAALFFFRHVLYDISWPSPIKSLQIIPIKSSLSKSWLPTAVLIRRFWDPLSHPLMYDIQQPSSGRT